MIRNFLLLCIALGSITCSNPNVQEKTSRNVQIIPKPQSVEAGKGTFKITSKTTLSAPLEFEIASSFLQEYLEKGAGIDLKKASEKEGNIIFKIDSTTTLEGYSLHISEEKIEIRAADHAGAFYAVQTLRQLLPPTLERINSLPKNSVELPQVTITDAPRFQYRGMHLDVSRHFFPKAFIKKYISYLAMLKMNRFHWHLTDDQGWRIEIKEYPLLTQKAAFRDETLIGHYNESPQLFDGKRYGGFYTQEAVKEIVAYAESLNITIIPEIEMPGHAQAAISAYPELGCTGKDTKVATKWGVFETIYCPNQKTFAFLKNTLTEVMELFPSEYIHIGGDEAPKTQWKACSHCKNLIKEKNLRDEDGLQSWFLKEIEAFVNSKGKKIIGWDEILEGGLAPNATVMSWRGTEGAIEAAKQGNHVIMTPTSHAYFDYYQDDHPDEPLAIGGFLPLKKVYGFNPIPSELEGAEKDKVLGAQGNVWTEYITTTAQVEYMAFPRIVAMAEVVWSGPTENIDEDYPGFLSRLEEFNERLDVLKVNYANHLYDLEGAVLRTKEGMFYEITTPTPGKEITYSINTSEEKPYSQPIKIAEDTKITAHVYKNGDKVGRPFSETIVYHKGVIAGIGLNTSPHPAYNTGGISALNNGVSGSDTRFGDKEWLGFWGDDVKITLDFSASSKLTRLKTRFYNANGQWIYAPTEATLLIRYEDGSNSKVSTTLEIDPTKTLIHLNINFPEDIRKVNSIRLLIPSYGTIPEGLQGAGNNTWTFIDEIMIE